MALIDLKIGHRWVAVTPSDTVDLPVGCVGIYVGTTGDLAMVDAEGDVVVFATVPVGYYELSPTRINATATTADDIVAVYA